MATWIRALEQSEARNAVSGVSAAFRGEPVGDEVRERAFKRLKVLWTLEAVNVVLVPAAVTGVVVRSGGSIGLPMICGGLLCAALLVLGTVYWRAKLAQLRSRESVLPGRAGFARVTWLHPTPPKRGQPGR